MNTIYYIGGSPCSGKSTVAEILSKKYSLYYFKVDDFLEDYIKAGAFAGYPTCQKIVSMDAEQTWMRDPAGQCSEEFAFYKETFEYLAKDLRQISYSGGILTEGAAYVPAIMKQAGIPYNRYLSVTPTEQFQVFHYQKRAYVPFVLEGCLDKEKAFSNWMERDVLFAKEVRRQCVETAYASIVNDGSMEIDEMADKVAAHFGLGDDAGGRGAGLASCSDSKM